MDTKKLAKIIKLVVEHELKRQLPDLIKEGVSKVLTESKNVPAPVTSVKKKPKKTIQKEEVDPFSLANSMLDGMQDTPNAKTPTVAEKRELKKLSKNPILNEILNNTKPFKDRGGPPQYGTEAPAQYGQSEQLDESYDEMDKTVSFDKNIGPAGADGLKSQMASKMGYNDTQNKTPKTSGGLGVSTGLPGLDRIMNRDNSDLVSKFKTRK